MIFKSRKERVAEYGSFLYCPQKDTLCSQLDNDSGICERALCYLEDLEYIALREKIEKNIKKNAMRELEKESRKKDGTNELKAQINKKEEKARVLYKQNKPAAADAVMGEVMVLRGKLRNHERRAK